MKTIQQLLELSKNPYYKFTADEQAVFDSFLSKRRDSRSKKSQETDSNRLLEKTPVTVRNIVHKVDTYPPEAPENL